MVARLRVLAALGAFGLAVSGAQASTYFGSEAYEVYYVTWGGGSTPIGGFIYPTAHAACESLPGKVFFGNLVVTGSKYVSQQQCSITYQNVGDGSNGQGTADIRSSVNLACAQGEVFDYDLRLCKDPSDIQQTYGILLSLYLWFSLVSGLFFGYRLSM